MPWENVSWTNLRNTTYDPVRLLLYKSSGVQYAYDADAVSSEQIAAAVEGQGTQFQLWTPSVGGVFCGLTHSNVDADYDTIDFALGAWGGDIPLLGAYYQGSLQADLGGPSFDFILRLVFNASGQIDVVKNDVVVYTFTQLPTLPLFVDCSLSLRNIFSGVYAAKIFSVIAKIDHLPLCGVH